MYEGGASVGNVLSNMPFGTCAIDPCWLLLKLCLHDSLRMFSALRDSKCSSYSFLPSLFALRRFETRSEQMAAQPKRSEAIGEPSF